MFIFYHIFAWILHLEITSRHLASHVKDSTQERAACRTCSTIICLSFDQSMIIVFRCRCSWLPLSFPKILYLPTTAKYFQWKDLLLAKIGVRFVLFFIVDLDYANSHLSSLTNSLPTNDTYHHVVWIQQSKGTCTVVDPFQMLFIISRRSVCHATTWRSGKEKTGRNPSG